MPSRPNPEKITRRFEREQAKARVVRAYKEGRDWHEVARSNNVNYSTASRAVLAADEEAKVHSGVRASNVKLTVDAMVKLEEYIEEDSRRTLADLRDKLESDLGVSVCKSSIHRALQGMLYSTKHLRIEKATMNPSGNKAKRNAFVESLNSHIDEGNMIVFQDEINDTKRLHKFCPSL
ncbi:unnamed protein product [Phytophthora fragariaefolia]|uniref:Unnamed protein product n=1 Tax=Phytophthora fragariaefolia TaxID=1490495 RepID=A0A9W6XWF4_9STRA|nr:unnamed protein product [Phytophthora fragariaefolia]